MNTGDTLSIVSLALVGLSVCLTIWNLVHQLRSSRVTQTGRLHEVWWSREIMDTRQEVFGLSRDLVTGGAQIAAIAAYYHSPFTTAEPPGRAALDKLIGFFCNVEICLRSGVLNEAMTCELFGEAHYADYQPLVDRLRTLILSNLPAGRHAPRWIGMTLDLERRMKRRGISFSDAAQPVTGP